MCPAERAAQEFFVQDFRDLSRANESGQAMHAPLWAARSRYWLRARPDSRADVLTDIAAKDPLSDLGTHVSGNHAAMLNGPVADTES